MVPGYEEAGPGISPAGPNGRNPVSGFFLDSLPGVLDLHPVTDTVGVIFCAIPIRDWGPDSDLTDLRMAGRPPVSTALDQPMPSDGPAPPLPGPHQRAGREETEADVPPATLGGGADDGSTSLSDPTLDAGPAPPPPGPIRGPGRAAEAADPPDVVVDFAIPSPRNATGAPALFAPDTTRFSPMLGKTPGS